MRCSGGLGLSGRVNGLGVGWVRSEPEDDSDPSCQHNVLEPAKSNGKCGIVLHPLLMGSVQLLLMHPQLNLSVVKMKYISSLGGELSYLNIDHDASDTAVSSQLENEKSPK
ncbi:hypothetical protein D5086_021617 [Populus alba]|uniref:Uncharacterized protein n=1 Tax=Populus alba TaxID=43335 RepID=A0ACC4BD22_POPAL